MSPKEHDSQRRARVALKRTAEAHKAHNAVMAHNLSLPKGAERKPLPSIPGGSVPPLAPTIEKLSLFTLDGQEIRLSEFFVANAEIDRETQILIKSLRPGQSLTLARDLDGRRQDIVVARVR